MLADTCPRTGCTMPLARSRAGRVVCTSCGLDVVLASASAIAAPRDDAKGESDPEPQPEQQPEQQDEEQERAPNGMAGAVVVPAASARNQRLTDAASAALGEKLLQGWTMLDAACERCGLPLLRDDARRVVCVGCQRDSGSVGAGGGGATAVPSAVQGSPSVGTSTQLMPRVLHVGSPRGGGGGQGQVARAGGGERTVGAASGGGGGSGVRTEGRGTGGVAARLPGPVVGDGEEEVVDVDGELWQAEIEAARAIKALRRKLGEATEAESCRVLGDAIYQLASAIKMAREAREVGVRRARVR